MRYLIYFTITSILLLSVQCSFGQGFNRQPNGIKTTIGNKEIEITFYTPSVVRVTRCSQNQANKQTSTLSDLSVIKSPEKLKLKERFNKNIISIGSDSIEVQIERQTGMISFFKNNNSILLSEKEGSSELTPIPGCVTPAFGIHQSFIIENGEGIYGLGQHQDGVMNYRNHSELLVQRNMQIAIPFLQSTKGYGLFWNNASATLFKDSLNEMQFFSEIGQQECYYFIYGGNADRVLAAYRTLTGPAPMVPRWALGYWQSKERYTSQYEVVSVVKKYRELGVPLDAIVQDWQYWGTNDAFWNSTSFGNPKFPAPRSMVDSIHNMHAHILISVWPSFGKQTDIYKTMEKKGQLLNIKTWPKDAVVYNAWDAKARQTYWSYLNKNLFQIGIDGWWLDATEPEADNLDTVSVFRSCPGAFKALHNSFPLASTGGVYRNQRKTSENKRVMILTRSAFAGQQRYGTAVWSGDIKSEWKVLHNQIAGGLNISLSGIPYWNTDIGGFAPNGSYPQGVADPGYRELYTRWLQFGAFTPIFRSHGGGTPREIWQFGHKGDWAYDAIEKFINLRYRLLPYLYSTSWDITAHNGTFMRPFMMDFPQDAKACSLNDEYLFGKSILVAPVTVPQYTTKQKGLTVVDFSKTAIRSVYLPKGAKWTDFWTGKSYVGGQELQKKVPIDIMPLYIKAGAIIPLGPHIQYNSKNDGDSLEIRVYSGQDGQFLLYEDEYDNYNYEKGKYATVCIKWDNASRILSIGNRQGTYRGMAKSRQFNIVLVEQGHGIGDSITKNPNRSICYNGQKLVIKF